MEAGSLERQSCVSIGAPGMMGFRVNHVVQLSLTRESVQGMGILDVIDSSKDDRLEGRM